KNEINKYSTIENIDDITDRVIINIPKSDPGKRIIVASNEDKKKRFIDEKINNPQIES
ncbi:18971_t:CDS:1, partial [Gigaspora rosea]